MTITLSRPSVGIDSSTDDQHPTDDMLVWLRQVEVFRKDPIGMSSNMRKVLIGHVLSCRRCEYFYSGIDRVNITAWEVIIGHSPIELR